MYDSLFRQFGVYRADSIEEFFDIARSCVVGTLSGRRGPGTRGIRRWRRSGARRCGRVGVLWGGGIAGVDVRPAGVRAGYRDAPRSFFTRLSTGARSASAKMQ